MTCHSSVLLSWIRSSALRRIFAKSTIASPSSTNWAFFSFFCISSLSALPRFGWLPTVNGRTHTAAMDKINASFVMIGLHDLVVRGATGKANGGPDEKRFHGTYFMRKTHSEDEARRFECAIPHICRRIRTAAKRVTAGS